MPEVYENKFTDFVKNLFNQEAAADKEEVASMSPQNAETQKKQHEIDRAAALKLKKVYIREPLDDKTKQNPYAHPEIKKLMDAFLAAKEIDHKRAEWLKFLKEKPEHVINWMLQNLPVENVTPPPPPEQSQKGDDPAAKATSNDISITHELLDTLNAKLGGGFDWKQSNRAGTKKNIDILHTLIGTKVLPTGGAELEKDAFVKFLIDTGLDPNAVKELIKLTVNKKIVKEQLTINNLPEQDMAELVHEINKFYPYAKEYLKFERPVSLNLVSDPKNAKDTFGKTAYYNPGNEQITIFVDQRHPKDMLRSFSHELVHHSQNCRGEFDRDFNVGENYIETDDHLREMEREAYDKGNMCLRTYESYLKKENKVMKEKTLRKAIREAIKRVVENKTKTIDEAGANPISGKSKKKDGRNVWDQLTGKPAPKEDDDKKGAVSVVEDSGEDEAWHQWKNEHADDDHIKEIEHHLKALRGDRDYEEHGAEHDHDKYEDEGMEEGLEDTGLTGADGDDDKKTYDDHFKKDAVEEDKAYTAKKEKSGADKRKGAEKRGAEGTLAKTKGHGRVDYVNEDEVVEEDEDYTAKKEKPGADKRGGAEKRGAEGTLAKTKGHGKVDYVNEEETTTSLHESMAIQKGQLVFDKLVKKWCK
tara:strand:+ start:60 stop:1991 length:1932 start_codon:yes stop_codon:yes gene_type:complete